MVRLGLVGCGVWGRNYLKIPSNVSGCSIDIVSRKSIAHPNIEDVLDSGVHGVIIASPPDSHFELARTCIERKIPFLLEKPIALSKSECYELTALARRAEVDFQVNHIHLYSSVYLRLRDIVRSWNYESIMCRKLPNLSITTRCGNMGPFRNYDPYIDYSPHDIAMILGLLEPSERNVDFKINIVDRTNVGSTYHLHMKNKFMESMTVVGNNFPSKSRSFLVRDLDSDNVVEYHNDGARINSFRVNGVDVVVNSTPPLISSVRAFVNLVRGITDWRSDLDFYDCIYNIATEKAEYGSTSRSSSK